VRLAREALKGAEKVLPRYSNRFFRGDYTQPQPFAILGPRPFFKTDYRGHRPDAAGFFRPPQGTDAERRWPITPPSVMRSSGS